MALDQTQNFVEVDITGTYTSTDTTISLETGGASEVPDPANGEYNLVWFDAENNAKPSLDPEVEIVRVTGRDTTNDTLNVTRGQENTTAVAHDTSNADYKFLLTPTSKLVSDIDAANFSTNSVTVGNTSITLGNSGSPEVDNLSGNNGSAGQFLQTDGTNLSFADVSSGGKFEDALANGQVLADDGNLYSSVQTAENNATDYIFIGAGTFNEVVTISTAGLTVVGSGRGTLIDGGTDSTAVTINAADVTLRDMNVRNDGVGDCILGDSTNGVDFHLENIKVTNAGNAGIAMKGDGGTIRDCHVVSSGQFAIEITGTGIIASENRVDGTNGDGIHTTSGECVIANNWVESVTDNGIVAGLQTVIEGNTVVNAGNHGVLVDSFADDNIVDGNFIRGSGNDGINIAGVDNIISSNRVADSTNSNIDDTGTGTTTSANITGASN